MSHRPVSKAEQLNLANFPVIALRSLLEERLVLLELGLVWERDAVYTLERVVGRVSQEVGRGVLETTMMRRATLIAINTLACLGDHEGLDLASVGNMGADAQVHHRSAAVDGGGGAIGDFGLDDVLLVLVVLYGHSLVSRFPHECAYICYLPRTSRGGSPWGRRGAQTSAFP